MVVRCEPSSVLRRQTETFPTLQGCCCWVFMAGRMERFTAMLSEGIVSVTVTRCAGHRPFLSVTIAAQQHAVRISGGGRISIA